MIKITNGEKIKALFPDMYQVEQSLEAWDSWWNAEYKEPTIRNCFGCKYATDNHNSGTEECHLCMWENQYTPTTKNDLAQERYQDLIDYFGDKETAKTILEDKKEFKAWLERLRWNVKRVDELARELEQLKETTKNDLGVDCISRQEISDYVESHIQEINTGYGDLNRHTNSILRMIVDYIGNMPSVTPQPRKGHWIADFDRWGDVVTTVNGYRCDKCNAFNSDKDNYCPNCGADMRGEEE